MAKVTVIGINLPQTAQKISRKVNDNPMTWTGKEVHVLQMKKPWLAPAFQGLNC